MAKGTTPKPPKPRKPKKCHICTTEFLPWSSTQKVCSPKCAVIHGKEVECMKVKRGIRKQEKLQRDDLRERRKALKTVSELKQEAQRAFNAFIRTRDFDQPCISCGEENPPDLHGGQWDCGHFKTVGGFPELRFVECNAYRQCKSCNAGSAKYGAKAATVERAYRESLVKKFGQELVDWLDGPHEMTNYRRDDFIRIRDEYRKKTRELRKRQMECAA